MIPPLLRIVPLLAVPLSVVAAQHHPGDGASTAARDSLSAMATVVSTTASPAQSGRSRTEIQLTQPMLAARGARFAGVLQYSAMLNAEHWTMPNGEPVPGIWGEGFVERRHPHTVVHEVMLSAAGQRGALQGPLGLALRSR